MGYLVGVGQDGEEALEAARGGGVVEGAVVATPQVPLSGVCHAVESPNTEEAVCGHTVTKVLDTPYPDFVGLEHCAACEAALAEAGET